MFQIIGGSTYICLSKSYGRELGTEFSVPEVFASDSWPFEKQRSFHQGFNLPFRFHFSPELTAWVFPSKLQAFLSYFRKFVGCWMETRCVSIFGRNLDSPKCHMHSFHKSLYLISTFCLSIGFTSSIKFLIDCFLSVEVSSKSNRLSNRLLMIGWNCREVQLLLCRYQTVIFKSSSSI